MNRREMSRLVESGELFEQPGEFRIEWRISSFTSLSNEVDKVFVSPKFYFSNACWVLGILPNKLNMTYWYVSLVRTDCGPPKPFSFSLGFKKADGKEMTIRNGGMKFSQENRTVLPRDLSDVLTITSELVPLDGLTVICILKSDAYQHTESSIFRRLLNLSLNFKNILNSRRRTDVVLKLSDGEIPAHRIILASRSEVFKRMFDAGMKESQTGEVNIEDGDEEAFRIVLSYLYSGDPEGLCTKNMIKVYKVAHKYDLQALTKLCVDYMHQYLTVDTVADVIAFAELYQEMTLRKCAKDYFAQHKTELFQTPKWKRMKTENPAEGIEIMEYVFGE